MPCILVVDDERSLCELFEQFFASNEFKIVSFSDSEQALAWFREVPESIDLIITDQTMPRVTGVDLVLYVRTIRPELPIIMMTGFSEALDEELALKIGANLFIRKPFCLDKMHSDVALLLAEDVV